MTKTRFSRGVRKYIRREKARIRRRYGKGSEEARKEIQTVLDGRRRS